MKNFMAVAGGLCLLAATGCAASSVGHTITSVTRVASQEDPPVLLVHFMNDEQPRSPAAQAFFDNFGSFFANQWFESCADDAYPVCLREDNQVAVIQDGSLVMVMISNPDGPEKFREVSEGNIETETSTMAAKRLAREAVRALISR